MTGRRSLAFRIALLTATVSVLTGVIAGLLGINLIRRADVDGAQQSLARVATELAANTGAAGTARARIGLRALRVSVADIGTTGTVTGANPLSRNALSTVQVQRVLAGRSISLSERVDGVSVLVQARPTSSGGIVVAQRRSDALSVSNAEIRRLLLALLVAVLVAIGLGVLVARRLARPLRRTAAAAHALAAGSRGVEVRSEGPAEVAEVADAVNTLAAHLGASEARQREFLLSVSHDLRTPLTAITGYAESMADGLVPADRIPEIGRVLGSEAQRLSRLVGDLLDLARLEAQDVRLEVVDVDLDALLHGAGEVWSERCSRAGVVFSVEQGAPGVRLATDPNRLRQVLDGLLENALRVTPAGRPVVLAAHRVAAGVAIEIRDGGPGLTDDDLRVAFDRSALYDRYRGVRQVGTGLGLAIVHRLVERLGGSVEAGHASVEGGACFAVTLPVG